MKILVAGASGAVGRPLVAQLQARGHDVIAVSRTATGEPGARVTVAVADVLDRASARRVMEEARPDAVISQLTSLPKRLNPRQLADAYSANNKVRLEGTRNLLEAAQAVGVGRFVAQSAGFFYAPSGGDVKTEADPLWADAPEPFGEAVRTVQQMENLVLAARSSKPTLLRYATFYGPGTWFARDGMVAELTRRRQYPIVAGGRAVSSFVHVEDAAAAAVMAAESNATGIFNVADDEPAAAREWIPVYAEALGARPPRKVPYFLARLAIGRALAEYTVKMRGASNQNIRAFVGWTPRYSSWREGFKSTLG